MFLRSSELTRIGDKNYLQLFLEKEYPYTIKYDGNDIDMLELFFEEPNAADVSELRKLGISLEKLISHQNLKSIRIFNTYTRNSVESISDMREEEGESGQASEEIKDKTTTDKAREVIRELLLQANDFEDESSDYYLELSKFFNFLEKKCFRSHGDGIALKNSLSCLDKYNAVSCFIKEEILIEYIAFFFSHFPSRSLFVKTQI